MQHIPVNQVKKPHSSNSINIAPHSFRPKTSQMNAIKSRINRLKQSEYLIKDSNSVNTNESPSKNLVLSNNNVLNDILNKQL